MMILPLQSYRFQLSNCAPEIYQNVKKVHVDVKNQTITVDMVATLDPRSTSEALQFHNSRGFKLEFKDREDTVYSLAPVNLRMTGHSFDLDYGLNKPIIHRFEWRFDRLDVIVPQATKASSEPFEPAEGFLEPAAAVAQVTKDLTGGEASTSESLRFGEQGC